METLRIEWHRRFFQGSEGYMELKVDGFFPCTQQKAKIVFPLINRWCSDEVIDELRMHFQDKIDSLETTLKPLANKATSFPAKSKECREYTAEFKHNKALIQRYKKNLIALKGSDG